PAGDGPQSDRKRGCEWDANAGNPCPSRHACGRTQSRDYRFGGDTFPAGQWRFGHRHATHACAPPTRSDVRFASARSALPKTRRGETVNLRSFLPELKRRNVYNSAREKTRAEIPRIQCALAFRE